MLCRWHNLRCLVLLTTLGSSAAALAAPPVRFLASRAVRIDFQADQSVDAVDLFASRDGGRTWAAHDIERRAPDALFTKVESDGPHDFYLVLRNAVGATTPPGPLADPHARLVIDTLPPTVQLHDAAVAPLDAGRLSLRVRLTLIEENLGPDPVRLFLESSAAPPQDLGHVTLIDRELLATLPATPTPPADATLRVVVTDLAGNRATTTLDALLRASEPASRPAATERQLSAVDPMPPQDLAAGEPDPEALATQARAAALRSQAAAFRQQGRHPLAAARSRAANELLPDDPALLSELAGDLFNANEPEQAAEFFQRALHHEPDRPDALSGLALVEAARQRYPAALDHLRRLTERQPDDARAWLRYGDIAHKLGRTSEAVNAWRKAIEAASADQDTRTRARKRLDVLAPKPDGV